MNDRFPYYELHERLESEGFDVRDTSNLPNRLSRFVFFEITYKSVGEDNRRITLGIYFKDEYVGGIDIVKRWDLKITTFYRVFSNQSSAHEGSSIHRSSIGVKPFVSADGIYHYTFNTLSEMFLSYFHAYYWENNKKQRT